MTQKVGVSPFPRQFQLNHDLDSVGPSRALATTSNLPGRPDILLQDSGSLTKYLYRDLWAPDLERVARHLWILSTPWSGNINPLHKQMILGRSICVTEEPRLHLVWIENRIFIKPLPVYLLSAAFWDIFLLPDTSSLGAQRNDICCSGLGLLRSYALLIKHESDLVIAQGDQLRLLPRHLSWESFCNFSSWIANIDDRDVSGRYLYGELRLSRLNMYAPLLFNKFHYQRVHGQFADYFARFYGPILSYFALLATTLSGMQVVLAGNNMQNTSPAFILGPFFSWFSVIVVFLGLAITTCFTALWFFIVCREWNYSYRTHKRRAAALQNPPSTT